MNDSSASDARSTSSEAFRVSGDDQVNVAAAMRAAADRERRSDAPLRVIVDDPVSVSREEALRILAEPIREAFADWKDVVGREVTVTNVFAWKEGKHGRAQWVLDFDIDDRASRITLNCETLGRTPGRDARVRSLRALVEDSDGGVPIVFVDVPTRGRPRQDFELAPSSPPLARSTSTSTKSIAKSTAKS